MMTLNKYTLLLILFQFSCVYPMNLGHIINCHVYNGDKKYTDIVKNSENGVISAVNMHHRKTIFPETMRKNSLEKDLLYTWQRGEVLAETPTIKYIRRPYSNLVIGMAKNSSGNIVTAYPVLKYIPLSFMHGANKDLPIYIATVYDENNKKAKNVSSKVSEIQKIGPQGIFVGFRWTPSNEGIAVMDISSYYTNEIFSGIENERGSILVEVECIVINENLVEIKKAP